MLTYLTLIFILFHGNNVFMRFLCLLTNSTFSFCSLPFSPLCVCYFKALIFHYSLLKYFFPEPLLTHSSGVFFGFMWGRKKIKMSGLLLCCSHKYRQFALHAVSRIFNLTPPTTLFKGQCHLSTYVYTREDPLANSQESSIITKKNIMPNTGVGDRG